jgi:hypothetical protein
MFNITDNGVQMLVFLTQLMKDKDFDIFGDITPAYLEEVGYELHMSQEDSRKVIQMLVNSGMLNVK